MAKILARSEFRHWLEVSSDTWTCQGQSGTRGLIGPGMREAPRCGRLITLSGGPSGLSVFSLMLSFGG